MTDKFPVFRELLGKRHAKIMQDIRWHQEDIDSLKERIKYVCDQQYLLIQQSEEIVKELNELGYSDLKVA